MLNVTYTINLSMPGGNKGCMTFYYHQAIKC